MDSQPIMQFKIYNPYTRFVRRENRVRDRSCEVHLVSKEKNPLERLNKKRANSLSYAEK